MKKMRHRADMGHLFRLIEKAHSLNRFDIVFLQACNMYWWVCNGGYVMVDVYDSNQGVVSSYKLVLYVALIRSHSRKRRNIALFTAVR